MQNVIAKIKEEIAERKPYSNEWNVLHQLWDIVAADPKAEQIVAEDLENPDMAFDKLIKKVLSGRPNAVEAMRKICEFYGLSCPEVLPPSAEYTEQTAKSQKRDPDDFDLFDLV